MELSVAGQGRQPWSRADRLRVTHIMVVAFVGILAPFLVLWAEKLGMPVAGPPPAFADDRRPPPGLSTPQPTVRPGSPEAIRLSFLRWVHREPAPEEVAGRLGQDPEVIEAEIRESLEARRLRSSQSTRARPSGTAVAHDPFTWQWVDGNLRLAGTVINRAVDWTIDEATVSLEVQTLPGGPWIELERRTLPEIPPSARQDVVFVLPGATLCACSIYAYQVSGWTWTLRPGLAD